MGSKEGNDACYWKQEAVEVMDLRSEPTTITPKPVSFWTALQILFLDPQKRVDLTPCQVKHKETTRGNQSWSFWEEIELVLLRGNHSWSFWEDLLPCCCPLQLLPSQHASSFSRLREHYSCGVSVVRPRRQEICEFFPSSCIREATVMGFQQCGCQNKTWTLSTVWETAAGQLLQKALHART